MCLLLPVTKEASLKSLMQIVVLDRRDKVITKFLHLYLGKSTFDIREHQRVEKHESVAFGG